MSKKNLNSVLFIITYTVFLALALMKFDSITALGDKFLSALTPFFIGFCIAFVLHRPCNFFVSRFSIVLKGKSQKLARPLAITTSYFLLIAVIVTLLSFILPKVAESIGIFISGLEGAVVNLQLWVNELINYFNLESLSGLEFDFNALSNHINRIMTSILDSMGSAAGQVVAFTGSVFSHLITLTISIVFSIYMLSGGDTLRRQCRRVLSAYVSESWAIKIQHVVDISANTFTKFVSGQLTEACILGALCAVGMLFIEADYAPLIGIIIGISALIPVAGAYLGGALAAFLLLMVSPVSALVFVIFIVILQQIEGNIIYPRVVGTSIGLPGIWVLTAVTVGGGLFGLPGVLLSVPTVSVLYTLIRMDVRHRLGESKESI